MSDSDSSKVAAAATPAKLTKKEALKASSDALKHFSLAELSDEVLTTLKKYDPVRVPEMDPALHYLAPHGIYAPTALHRSYLRSRTPHADMCTPICVPAVPKATWTVLGDLVATREKTTNGNIPGERWYARLLPRCMPARTRELAGYPCGWTARGSARRHGACAAPGYSRTATPTSSHRACRTACAR